MGGASGKWRHLPWLQSSHLMFPITAHIAARPAPYLTADYRPSFIFLLLFPLRCQYPLALCAQTANNKNESFECATFGFATQASAVYIMSKLVSVSLFKLQFLPGFWSWGSSFRWNLIQVLCIYLFIFTGGRVFTCCGTIPCQHFWLSADFVKQFVSIWQTISSPLSHSSTL